MTTDTTDAAPPPAAPARIPLTPGPHAGDQHRLTLLRVVRSEWVKLVTIRSTLWALLAVAVLMVGIAAIAASTATGATEGVGGPGGGPGVGGSDPLTTVLAGQTPAVLVLGILGVVRGAREYGSGLVRTTMTAVPRRWPALLGRVLAFLGLAVPVVVLSTVAAYAVGTTVLERGGVVAPAGGDDGTARVVLGTARYLVGLGALGLGLGVLLRSLGAAIGAFAGLLLLAPGLGQLLLPDDWQGGLDYLPSQAATAFTTLDGPFPPWAGAVIVTSWVVAAVAAAWVRLVRSDV